MSRLVHEVLAERAAATPGRVALQFDDRTLTYGELDAASGALAAALQRRGVRKGDLVVQLLSNRHEFAVADFALMRLGAVAVPVNTALKGDGLAYYFKQSGATLALVEAGLLSRLEAALGGWGALQRVVVVGESGTEPAPATAPPQGEPFGALLAEAGSAELPPILPSDPWAILYTSGTTGPSKGVVLPYQWLATATDDAIRLLNIRDDSVTYTFMPLFHANAKVFGMTAAIVTGIACVVRGRFPREGLWDDLRQTGATHTTMPPFVIYGLLASPPQPTDRNNPVQLVLSMSLGEKDWLAFEERFGLKLVVGYGITEAGMICIGGRERLGSSGRASDRLELAIVDELDRPLPPGRVGEIVVRPRRPYEIMLGYYKMPEATVASVRNLWLHTGDAGYLDADGYLFFADRLKDMIKRRGENVSSFEVEQAIYLFPGVAEVAVVPHRMAAGFEEEVRAFIVPKPGARIDPGELVVHCARHLAHFQVPRYIDVRGELPHNSVGKLEKFKLHGIPLDEQTFDRKAAGIAPER